MAASALPGILALRVLTDNDPVEITGAAIPQGRLGPSEDLGRPHVGVLLERLADRQAEAPERDVVRDVYRLVSKDLSRPAARQRAKAFYAVLTWGADGAKQDSVVLLELLESAIGNVFPGLLIGVRAPVKVSEVNIERP